MAETEKKTTTKTTAKKTTTKKAPAKKPAAKKTTTAKKAPVKKPAVKKEPEVKVEAPKTTTEDVKVYKYLSYIGILWIIGFFVKEKDDASLKFHMGQGIILTILGAALITVVALVNNLVIYNVFVTKTVFWGYETVTVSGFGIFLAGLLNLALWAVIVFFVIKGIINVRDNKDEALPIVGKFSFFK